MGEIHEGWNTLSSVTQEPAPTSSLLTEVLRRPPQTTRKGRMPLPGDPGARKASRHRVPLRPLMSRRGLSGRLTRLSRNGALGIYRVKTLFYLRWGFKNKFELKTYGKKE